MALFEPKLKKGGEGEWSERLPWTDEQTILLSVENSITLCGLDKNQVERIIKERMDPPKYFSNRLMG